MKKRALTILFTLFTSLNLYSQNNSQFIECWAIAKTPFNEKGRSMYFFKDFPKNSNSYGEYYYVNEDMLHVWSHKPNNPNKEINKSIGYLTKGTTVRKVNYAIDFISFGGNSKGKRVYYKIRIKKSDIKQYHNASNSNESWLILKDLSSNTEYVKRIGFDDFKNLGYEIPIFKSPSYEQKAKYKLKGNEMLKIAYGKPEIIKVGNFLWLKISNNKPTKPNIIIPPKGNTSQEAWIKIVNITNNQIYFNRTDSNHITNTLINNTLHKQYNLHPKFVLTKLNTGQKLKIVLGNDKLPIVKLGRSYIWLKVFIPANQSTYSEVANNNYASNSIKFNRKY